MRRQRCASRLISRSKASAFRNPREMRRPAGWPIVVTVVRCDHGRVRSRHPQGHGARRHRLRSARRRRGDQGRSHRGGWSRRRRGPRGDRRQGPHRDAGLRRRAHTLRRPGNLGRSVQPVVGAWRDDRADGHCGVGFAPCRPQDRHTLIKVMEGVEDIPEIVMQEGVPWNWQSFPEYLDALAARRCDIDFAAQVPHAPLRVFVMGQRGVDREPATAQDMATMAALVQEGLEAGALGFSTSRSLFHRTTDGVLTPTITAAEEELTAIARGMRRAGKGVIQLLDDFADATEQGSTEFGMLRRLVEASGRPLSFTLLDISIYPGRWKTLLREVDRANRDGLPIKGQVAGRPVALLYGLELSFNPFSTCPSYAAVADLPLAQKLANLRDPALRAKLLVEPPTYRN